MSKIYPIIFYPCFLFILIFIVSVILFAFIIKVLKIHQFGQVVRDDGPKTHLKKSGTPTMAGIVYIIIFVAFAALLYLCDDYINNPDIKKMSIVIILFGIIGFIDDFLKVTKRNTKGLPSLFKLILQIVFAGLGLYVCDSISIMLSPFVFVFYIFIIVGTDNGVNFTDGLDGLCTMVTIIVSLFYIVLCIDKKNIELMYIPIVVLAMCIAFMIYNHYPAKAFMGDAGSLFLGAYVAFMAIALKVQYYLPLYGFIYMIEVVSVIMQVSYFKLTHGKRIFKMAPIHHHFEKCGYSEVQIVFAFTIVTIILCGITYILVR